MTTTKMERKYPRAMTDEEEASAVRAYLAGKSCAELARELGRSHSQLLDAIRRAKVPVRANENLVHNVARARLAHFEAMRESKSTDEEGGSGVTLELVPARGCTFPTGFASGRHLFCAEPAVEGRPYCGEHCRRAYDRSPRTMTTRQRDGLRPHLKSLSRAR